MVGVVTRLARLIDDALAILRAIIQRAPDLLRCGLRITLRQVVGLRRSMIGYGRGRGPGGLASAGQGQDDKARNEYAHFDHEESHFRAAARLTPRCAPADRLERADRRPEGPSSTRVVEWRNIDCGACSVSRPTPPSSSTAERPVPEVRRRGRLSRVVVLAVRAVVVGATDTSAGSWLGMLLLRSLAMSSSRSAPAIHPPTQVRSA